MNRGAKHVHKGKQGKSDLDQYRHLVALQKQMIQLAQEYERTKRECDDLREQMKRKPVIVLPLKRHEPRPAPKKESARPPKTTAEKFGLRLIIGGSIAEAAQKAVKTIRLKRV